jgi:hypothetical protein
LAIPHTKKIKLYSPPIAVKTQEGWFAAFWNPHYQDYVIELCHRRRSKKNVEDDIQSKRVYANMPCPFEGK